MNIFARAFFSAGALTFAVSALADIPLKVEGAWVHSTVPGQQGAAAFMRLTGADEVMLDMVSANY